MSEALLVMLTAARILLLQYRFSLKSLYECESRFPSPIGKLRLISRHNLIPSTPHYMSEHGCSYAA